MWLLAIHTPQVETEEPAMQTSKRIPKEKGGYQHKASQPNREPKNQRTTQNRYVMRNKYVIWLLNKVDLKIKNIPRITYTQSAVC